MELKTKINQLKMLKHHEGLTDQDRLFLIGNMARLISTLADCSTKKYGKKTPVFCVEPSEATILRKILRLIRIDNYTITIKNFNYEKTENSTSQGTCKQASHRKNHSEGTGIFKKSKY